MLMVGVDSDGDVSDGSHGPALHRCSRISLYWQCASKAGNSLQNGLGGGGSEKRGRGMVRGLPGPKIRI